MVTIENKEDSKILNLEFDWKTISLIVLALALVMVVVGYNLRDTDVQDSFETIKIEKIKIHSYEKKITESQVKINNANSVLKQNGIEIVETSSGSQTSSGSESLSGAEDSIINNNQ